MVAVEKVDAVVAVEKVDAVVAVEKVGGRAGRPKG